MKKIVLFDFDGVIADTFDICYDIVAGTHRSLTKDEFRGFFEGNIYEAEEKLIKEGKFPNEEEFFAKYTPQVLEMRPIEGIPEVLEKLKEAYQLVVVSSTITSPIQRYLEKYDLVRHFDWIMGGDVHKSKTVKIKMVLAKYKVKPEDCVIITDTLGDAKEAAKCNVKSIGVTWGYHERERLEKGDFFALVDKVEELIPIVQSFFGKGDKSKSI